MTTTAVESIVRELDRAHDGGKSVRFWWRDDDAVRHTPALDRLLLTAHRHRCPIGLATVPARLHASLADRLSGEDTRVTVLVHGYAHANHAPLAEKSAEFEAHRALNDMLAEARRSREIVGEAFGARALDVFVPPWNRMTPDLEADLPLAGYRGVSAFGRPCSLSNGLVRMDTHLDPVDWRGSRGVAEPNAMSAMVTRAMRLSDGVGPIGLLTHHLQFDAELWDFTERLVALLSQHPSVGWCSPDELLARVPVAASEGFDVPDPGLTRTAA